MDQLSVGIAQLNPVVGDLDANASAIIDAVSNLHSNGAEIVVTGELSVSGYPPEDLLTKQRFVDDCWEQVERIAAETAGGPAVVLGVPTHDAQDCLYNSAVVTHNGEVVYIYNKVELPNYAVFDEKRWFDAGQHDQPLFVFNGASIGISVCEDIWIDDSIIHAQHERGAHYLININGSPFYSGKVAVRYDLLVRRAEQTGLPLCYVNQVGGQDDLIFDGASMVVGAEGELLYLSPSFEVDQQVVTIADTSSDHGAHDDDDSDNGVHDDMLNSVAEDDPMETLWNALVLGTRDYVTKNGFTDVVLGLSGGIDSALVAALAADAFGPEHTHVVMMPSRYSSDGSVADAQKLASNLGVDQRIIEIDPGHAALETMLSESFVDTVADVTEENLQARIRGVTLMALSNKFGWIVLTTGNKSEMAVGYSTLYGDSAGALAIIADVYKLDVYRLCEWKNSSEGREIIPETILNKAPSAELRPDQRDDQSLPPYDVLDPLLEAFIEGNRTLSELIEDGYDRDLATRIVTLVTNAEYKRRQSPPALRVTQRAFGRDRRIPMVNRYR